MIIYDQDPRLLDWAGNILNVKFNDAITICNADTEILAVVVYSRFSPYGCEMSIATSHPRWANKRFIKACYHYPFIQLNYKRVTVVVENGNDRSLDMCLRLGYKKEGHLREWFGEKDGILLGMLRSECKWINE